MSIPGQTWVTVPPEIGATIASGRSLLASVRLCGMVNVLRSLRGDLRVVCTCARDRDVDPEPGYRAFSRTPWTLNVAAGGTDTCGSAVRAKKRSATVPVTLPSGAMVNT